MMQPVAELKLVILGVRLRFVKSLPRWRTVREKMKIGVFETWIKQRQLEFDVHEVHSGKKKKEQLEATVDRILELSTVNTQI